jgi:hypothetical protein
MKTNLILLLGLVAISGSVSAMQEEEDFTMEDAMERFMTHTTEGREVKLSPFTQQMKNRLKHCPVGADSKSECARLAAIALNSWIYDIKGMAECANLARLNFDALDAKCRESETNGERYACTLNTLDRKLELLDLCLRAQTNENKK